jgi:HEAT repeats
MKKTFVLIAVLLVIVPVMPAMPRDFVSMPEVTKTLVEDNLFNGMSSENLGLQRGCALMLGEIQSKRAVIPLMNVLHNNTDENMRIAAAWALCKIGDARGVYAVKMAVKYDECTKVQATCAWYYENYVKQGTFTFAQPEPPAIAAKV